MKPVIYFLRKSKPGLLLCIVCLSLFPVASKAQLCTNPADSVYGMTTNGQFHSINVNNGAPSAGILGGVAVPNAVNSNGLGFSSVTGKFYFFNHCADSPNPNEFVSYDPITNTKVVLANPPAPLTNATANKIRSGAVDNSGTGYYTIFTNSPATAATFYYYNIPLNTWTVIAQTFKDTATGSSLDSMFHNLNSGDMTFDGLGNLWIICSKSPKYALYKVSAPVTTVAVPKLAVSVMIPTRDMPIKTSASSVTGIAFNSAGKLYMSTGSNSALLTGVSTVGTSYNVLYRMSSISPLVIDSISNLPNSYGDDLSSCIYPVGILSNFWISFSALLQKNSISLTWKVNEGEDVSAYDIEFSNDAEHWKNIGHVVRDNFTAGNLKTYNYTDAGYSKEGNNYYRIVQLSSSDRKNISETKLVSIRAANKIYIGPNPAKDIIYFYNRDNSSKLLAQVFDHSGKLISSTIVPPGQQSIDISHLSKGNFVLRLVSPDGNTNPAGYQFIKW